MQNSDEIPPVCDRSLLAWRGLGAELICGDLGKPVGVKSRCQMHERSLDWNSFRARCWPHIPMLLEVD